MGMVSAGTTAAAAVAEGCGGASTGRSAAIGGRQRSLSAFLLLSSVKLGHEMPSYLNQTALRMGGKGALGRGWLSSRSCDQVWSVS